MGISNKKTLEEISQHSSTGSIEIKDEGVSLSTEVGSLDFIGSGVDVTNSNGEVTVTITATTGAGHSIQENGTTVVQRANLNFEGSAVTVTDDGVNDRTTITISGGNISLATASENGLLSSTDFTKLQSVEENATADQTGAEIKAAYEAESDTNAFTDAQVTKLASIEAGADITPDIATIAAAYEGLPDRNPYTDSEVVKLAAIEANATADQDASEVVVVAAGNLTSTNVQAALEELQADIDSAGGGSGTDDQTAAEVSVVSFGNLTATDVQAALEELQGDIDSFSTSGGGGVSNSSSALIEEVAETDVNSFSFDVSKLEFGETYALSFEGEVSTNTLRIYVNNDLIDSSYSGQYTFGSGSSTVSSRETNPTLGSSSPADTFLFITGSFTTANNKFFYQSKVARLSGGSMALTSRSGRKKADITELTHLEVRAANNGVIRAGSRIRISPLFSSSSSSVSAASEEGKGGEIIFFAGLENQVNPPVSTPLNWHFVDTDIYSAYSNGIWTSPFNGLIFVHLQVRGDCFGKILVNGNTLTYYRAAGNFNTNVTTIPIQVSTGDEISIAKDSGSNQAFGRGLTDWWRITRLDANTSSGESMPEKLNYTSQDETVVPNKYFETSAGLYKPMYRKIIQVASFPNNTTVDYPNNISANSLVSESIKVTGRIVKGSNIRTIPQSGNSFITAFYLGTQIRVITGDDFSTYSGYLEIEYAKISDTEISL